MSNDTESKIKATADRIIELDKEVEASSHSATDEPSLLRAREVLHQWVDSMKGVVVSPANGRVSIIDENGYAASIASAQLAFKMSAAGVIKSG